jgi:hypothetical protein
MTAVEVTIVEEVPMEAATIAKEVFVVVEIETAKNEN